MTMTLSLSLSAAGGRGVQGHMTVLPRPLEGLRVLDLSRAVSGPFAGRILGDLGADVVKVEPPAGDLTDAFGAVQAGRAGLYAQMNVGKRNVQLDLAREEDLALARGMASVADVVIENYRPGVLDRLGLGWGWLAGSTRPPSCFPSPGSGPTGPNRRGGPTLRSSTPSPACWPVRPAPIGGHRRTSPSPWPTPWPPCTG
jgi:hypothetical protein